MVTISTLTWVSARSGAENQTKVRQVIEAGHRQHRERGEAVELRQPRGADGADDADRPQRRNSSDDGSRGRSPHVNPPSRSDANAASTASTTTSSNCGCSRRVPSGACTPAKRG